MYPCRYVCLYSAWNYYYFNYGPNQTGMSNSFSFEESSLTHDYFAIWNNYILITSSFSFLQCNLYAFVLCTTTCHNKSSAVLENQVSTFGNMSFGSYLNKPFTLYTKFFPAFSRILFSSMLTTYSFVFKN